MDGWVQEKEDIYPLVEKSQVHGSPRHYFPPLGSSCVLKQLCAISI